MHISLKKVESNGEIYCETSLGINFYLRSFNKGVMTIEPTKFVTIENFAEMVSACFYPSSNISDIKRIKFNFNGTPISVSAKKSTKFLIVKQYYNKRNKNNI